MTRKVRDRRPWACSTNANADRKIALMRRAQTLANDRYGIGGKLKLGHHQPRKITLPKVPWEKTE